MMAVEAYRSTNRVRSAGRASGLASTPLRERVTALRESTGRAYHRIMNWLEADPREVVRARQSEVVRARRSEVVPASRPKRLAAVAAGEPGTSALRTGELGAGELGAELRRFRTRVARQRARVLLRRQLIAAAVLGVAVQAFVLAGLIPQWALLAVLAPLVLGLTLALRRRITLEGVARLLDERLGLFDQLATALEIERRGTALERPLERRALARAAAVLETDSPRWRLSTVPAAREWLWLGACLALLGLLIGLNASGAVSASSKAHAGIGQGVGSSQVAGHGTRHGKAGKHKTTASHHGAASANANRLQGTATRVHRPGQSTSHLEHRRLPPNVSPKGKAPGANNGSTTAPSQSTHSGISPVSRPSPMSASARHGLTPGHPGASAPSTKTSAPRPASHGAGQRSKATGHTKGGNAAGNGAARNRLTHRGLSRGRISQQLQLSLPAGYVPVHSSRTGEIGRGAEKVEGGGGRGRSAKVGGEGSASSRAAGGFAYVPPDGGATAGGRASLLDRYFSHLRWIEQKLASW
jgi:hypothetical protein